jgi:streptogramin lyase
MPLGFWYLTHAGDATRRGGQIVFYFDAAYREILYPGLTLGQILVAQLRQGFMGLAASGDPAWMHYGVDEPLVDPVAGALLLATVLGVSLSWRRREVAFVAIWFWLPALAVILLTDRPPPMTRLIMVVPALYAMLGFGLDRIGQVVERAGGRGVLALFALPLALGIAYAGVWNTTNFFVRHPQRQPEDRQTMLLRTVDRLEPTLAVYVIDDVEYFEGRDLRMVTLGRVGASLMPQELPLPALGYRDAAFLTAAGRTEVLGPLQVQYPHGELSHATNARGEPVWDVYRVSAGELEKAAPSGSRWWQYDAVLGEPGNRFGDLADPRAVAVDVTGRVYVGDAGRGKVVVFDPDGQRLAEIGRPGTGNGGLKQPSAVTLDRSGDVLVADETTGWIQRFSPDGRWLGKLGGPGVLRSPSALAIGPDGAVLVGDFGLGAVVRLDADGASRRSPVSFQAPTGVAVAADGTVFVVDSATGRVRRLGSDLTQQAEWAVPPPGPGPTRLSISYGDGAVWVADPRGLQVIRYAPTGERQWSVGGKPGDPTALRNTFHGDPLSYRNIASDARGSLYVLDGIRGRVFRYDVAKRRW